MMLLKRLRKTYLNSNISSTETKSENPTLRAEAEKQSPIWRAFRVDYNREISQLAEAKNQLPIQLNNSLMNDELKNLIEQIVRDEVRRCLEEGRLATVAETSDVISDRTVDEKVNQKELQ